MAVLRSIFRYNASENMNLAEYRSNIISEFRKTKRLAERALSQITEQQFFQTINDESNSIAIIVKHVSGNLRSRWKDFLTSDGEKPDRNRDKEFVIQPKDTRSSLIEKWEQGWSYLFSALTDLEDQDLEAVVYIRGEPHKVYQATNRQFTHYSYHVGQIVYIAKHLCGQSWSPLSIPKGTSRDFNANPEKYLEDNEDS